MEKNTDCKNHYLAGENTRIHFGSRDPELLRISPTSLRQTGSKTFQGCNLSWKSQWKFKNDKLRSEDSLFGTWLWEAALDKVQPQQDTIWVRAKVGKPPSVYKICWIKRVLPMTLAGIGPTLLGLGKRLRNYIFSPNVENMWWAGIDWDWLGVDRFGWKNFAHQNMKRM